MTKKICCSVIVIAVAALLGPLTSEAANEEEARKHCKAKISQVYDLHDFRKTHTEPLGHHKVLVQGQVKAAGHYHKFECRTKYGEVSSYSYAGPHNRHDDDSDKAVAIGAGLAVLAAVAIAANDDDGGKLGTDKTVLEDMCHDMLLYRVRDEQDRSAHVKIHHSSVHGRDLKGEAKVKYDHGHPNDATFTCHFNKQGHLVDASYHLH